MDKMNNLVFQYMPDPSSDFPFAYAYSNVFYDVEGYRFVFVPDCFYQDFIDSNVEEMANYIEVNTYDDFVRYIDRIKKESPFSV